MNQKGFTLVEMVIALALLSLFAVTTVPLMHRLERNTQMRRAARSVVSDISRAKVVASDGARLGAPWSAADRTTNAGILIASNSSYVVFADRDHLADGDEIVVRTVNLPDGMEITQPAPGQTMRFRQNGTIVTPFNVTIYDRQLNLSRTVVVASGGYARVN